MKPFTYSARLVKDAEVKEIKGKVLLTFEICHKESYKDSSGEWKDSKFYFTVQKWFNIVADAQKQLKRLKKDIVVYVEGIPTTEAWADKTSGEIKSKIVVRASEIAVISFIDYSTQSTQQAPQSHKAEPIADDDNLPF